ncbi:Flp pilus assembly protein CpaB [Tersicoccus sp. Bi-70]|uniref:Flp pilus assembly protein CpaB n=1 Tax=Tersicoccus sp. Bi-70 TaxID=1897634 RepID=UPI0009F9EFA8|nr:Flp pilus assembly protein CpaB [Tersicoccus sp. Bi-70]
MVRARDPLPRATSARAGRLVRSVHTDRSPPRRLLRLIRRRRRLLVALLLCGAVGVLVDGLTPAAALTVPVVVAVRDLPAGAVLTGGDVTRADWPPGAVPDGAVAAAEAVTGGRLGAPLRRGSPVTDAALLGPGLLTGAPPGQSAVPLRVSDPTVLRVLRPGDRVDVVLADRQDAAGAAGPERAAVRTIARSVTVLWTSASSAGAGAGSGASGVWPTANEDAPLAVVAVPRAAAAELAGTTGGTTAVGLVIVEPGG